ncbi:hypothetical protein V6917_21850 [Pectobacterium brasiliense]
MAMRLIQDELIWCSLGKPGTIPTKLKKMQHAVIVCEAIGVLHPDETVAESAMAVHDALGFTGPDPFSNRPGARLYKTGDLARWLPDGSIEYLGRNDFAP